MLWKGAAVAQYLNIWNIREMGDLDVQIEPNYKTDVFDFLEQSNYWEPMGDISWSQIRNRSFCRRDSWNFISAEGDILDLHWGFTDSYLKRNLVGEIFKDASTVKIFNNQIKIPSPEWIVASSIQHGFLKGTKGDKFQSIFDYKSLIEYCDVNLLTKILNYLDLSSEHRIIENYVLNNKNIGIDLLIENNLIEYFNPPWNRSVTSKSFYRFINRLNSSLEIKNLDLPLLNRKILYIIWDRIGRISIFEKVLVKIFGHFSRKISEEPIYVEDFLTVGWQVPDSEEIWSDRPDARMIINLEKTNCNKIRIYLSNKFKFSPNPMGFIFINGFFCGGYNLKEDLSQNYIEVQVPNFLKGKEIEVSFRPDPYVTKKEIKLRNIWQRQSIPIARGKFNDVIKFI